MPTLVALMLLGACRSAPTVMQPAERNLEIDGPIERQFHSVLYFPKGEALHYPGYILAIEKSPQDIIGGPKMGAVGKTAFVHGDSEYILNEPPPGPGGGTEDRIRNFQHRDRKALFVSHIIRYDVNSKTSAGAYKMVNQCFLYNAFKAEGVGRTKGDNDVGGAALNRLYGWHDCEDVSDGSKTYEASLDASSIGNLYGDGLDALKTLETQLTLDVRQDGYTHIVVIVMGWNTSQDEAIRNFNDIAGNIVEAAYEDANPNRATEKKDIAGSPAPARFRPLIVGVTWPSFWTNDFTNLFSYPNKAGDADELGLSWLNVLLNRTLPCVLKSTARPDGNITLGTVLIGHSFGARAATRALFSSPALETGPASGNPPSSVIELAVGLQGAMSINRFVPSESDEGAPYRDFAKLNGTHVVLTASGNDTATALPLWYDAAGSIKSYRKVCDGSSADYQQRFSCWKAVDDSEAEKPLRVCPAGQQPCTQSEAHIAQAVGTKVMYIDTSVGITEFNSPGSGGGAHSDIYRLPMGRLLWQLISAYAPPQPHAPAAPLICGDATERQQTAGQIAPDPR